MFTISEAIGKDPRPYLNDKAGIKTFGELSETKIVNNHVHDIYSFGTFVSGIYIDERGKNVEVMGNTIHSITHAGLFFYKLSGRVLARGNNVDTGYAIHAGGLHTFCSTTDLRIENNVFKTSGNLITKPNFCSELGADFSKSYQFAFRNVTLN